MKKLPISKPRISTNRLSQMSSRVKYWWLLVFASIVIVGFGFAAGWQNYRQNSYDPQTQYTQDIVASLGQGATPEAFGGSNMVDPRNSLGLFLIVTDNDKKVVASTMQLDSTDTPVPSDGMFKSAEKKQQRFLWKPHKDAKVAVVMQKYNNGYVLVARSSAEADKRIDQLAMLALGALLALVALATLGVRVGRTAPTQSQKAAAAPMQSLSFDEEKTEAPVVVPAEEDEKSSETVRAEKPHFKKKKNHHKK